METKTGLTLCASGTNVGGVIRGDRTKAKLPVQEEADVTWFKY